MEDKIHSLEEDKHEADNSGFGGSAFTGKSRKKKADPMDPDRRKKPVTVTGPFIVYMLEESEIMEDWQVIKPAQVHHSCPSWMRL